MLNCFPCVSIGILALKMSQLAPIHGDDDYDYDNIYDDENQLKKCLIFYCFSCQVIGGLIVNKNLKRGMKVHEKVSAGGRR